MYYLSLSLATCYHAYHLLFHYYVILPNKVKRTCKIRGRKYTVVSWFNRFPTERIPADAKEQLWLNWTNRRTKIKQKIEAQITFFFFAVE